MKNKYSYFFLLLLLSTSCSFFTKKVEQLSTPESLLTSPEKIVKKNLYCFENNKMQLLLEDDSTLKFYRPLLPNLFNTKSFSFIQKAAMLSLIEMSRRPDKASPSARLQYYLRLNNKNYYFDFHPKSLVDDTQASYLIGVDALLKNFDKSKNLITITKELEKYLPTNMDVSPDFEKFLQLYKNELIKDEVLSDIFLKGDETLTRHESFKRINLKKLVTLFNKEHNSNDKIFELSKKPLVELESGHSDLALKCNIDINKENQPQEEHNSNNQNNSHYFAIKDGDNFFIAVSSAIIKSPLTNYHSSYLMKMFPSPVAVPVCQFNNSLEDIVLFSSSGRNPEQHLKHLVTYDINLVDSAHTLEEILNFSRHLFLSNPDRILYESKRGRKSQLDFFLSMNFPIYHVESLGDIIGMGAFKKGNFENKSLILDDRSRARLWCGP